jgi:PBP1b-binding outer membrane lipoprotein LpoB
LFYDKPSHYYLKKEHFMKKRWHLTLLIIGALTLSACSGSSSSTPAPTPETTPAPDPTPAPVLSFEEKLMALPGVSIEQITTASGHFVAP